MNNKNEYILSDASVMVSLDNGQKQSFRIAFSKVEGAVVTGSSIRVIEHSAYESLQKENAELKSEIERLNNKYDFQLLVKENKELKEYAKKLEYDIENNVSDLKSKLDKAVSALGQINYYLSDIEHSNKRYSEVGKEDIAFVKIMPAVDCIREVLKEIGVE
jgi:DNA repair exonuclease SbcCD ATPase subunit